MANMDDFAHAPILLTQWGAVVYDEAPYVTVTTEGVVVREDPTGKPTYCDDYHLITFARLRDMLAEARNEEVRS